MADLELTAAAEANGRTWQFAGREFWRRGVIAATPPRRPRAPERVRSTHTRRKRD